MKSFCSAKASYSFRAKIFADLFSSARRINPIELRKAKIVCNFGLSECNRVNESLTNNFIRVIMLEQQGPCVWVQLHVFQPMFYQET